MIIDRLCLITDQLMGCGNLVTAENIIQEFDDV